MFRARMRQDLSDVCIESTENERVSEDVAFVVSFVELCVGGVRIFFFFFSSRRRHTRYWRDWSSDVCSSDLIAVAVPSAMPQRSSAAPQQRVDPVREGRGVDLEIVVRRVPAGAPVGAPSGEDRKSVV